MSKRSRAGLREGESANERIEEKTPKGEIKGQAVSVFYWFHWGSRPNHKDKNLGMGLWKAHTIKSYACRQRCLDSGGV